MDIDEETKDSKLAALDGITSITNEMDHHGIDWEFAINEKLSYEENEI